MASKYASFLFIKTFMFHRGYRRYQLVILCAANVLLVWKMLYGTFSHLRPNVFPDSGTRMHSQAASLHRNTGRIPQSACCHPNRSKGLVEITQNLGFAFPNAGYSPPAKVYFGQLEGNFLQARFSSSKNENFQKKSFNFKKSSLGDKLKSAILARNSKNHKSCI